VNLAECLTADGAHGVAAIGIARNILVHTEQKKKKRQTFAKHGEDE